MGAHEQMCPRHCAHTGMGQHLLTFFVCLLSKLMDCKGHRGRFIPGPKAGPSLGIRRAVCTSSLTPCETLNEELSSGRTQPLTPYSVRKLAHEKKEVSCLVCHTLRYGLLSGNSLPQVPLGNVVSVLWHSPPESPLPGSLPSCKSE